MVPGAVVLARGRAGYPALCRIVTKRHLEWTEEAAAAANRRARSGHPFPADTASIASSRAIAAEAGSVVVARRRARAAARARPAAARGNALRRTGLRRRRASAARCRETLAACRALGLPFVATNAVRFAAPEGFATHRVLRAIGENGTVWSTPPRAHAAHSLKSPAEMARALRAPARGARGDGAHRRGVRLPDRLRGLAFPGGAPAPRRDAVLRPLAEELRGAAAALPPDLARGGGAAALRALDHRGEGLLPVLPRRGRDRRPGARVGPADDRARLGGQQPRLALPRPDARGPARARALLRALSEPRALLAAGHRPGLLVEGPRPAAGVGLRALRRGARRDDLDARDVRAARGGARGRQGARPPRRRADAADQAHPALGVARPDEPRRDGARVPLAARRRRDPPARAGHRAAHRGAAAPPLGARRRDRDRARAAHELPAARARRQGARRDAVRHGAGGAARPREDRPALAALARRAPGRRRGRRAPHGDGAAGGRARRRPQRPRDAPPRARGPHHGLLLHRVPGDALAAAQAADRDLRGADGRQLGDPPRRRRERDDAGVHPAPPHRPGATGLPAGGDQPRSRQA